MIDPEAVLEAQFAWLVNQVPGLLTTGRRALHWTDVPAQPALFLRHIADEDAYSGTLPITTLECEVWLYSNAGEDPDVAPDIALTQLVKSVRTSFTPDTDDRFTLGGMVYWSRIDGRSDYWPGDQGGQAVAHIPIRITLPF